MHIPRFLLGAALAVLTSSLSAQVANAPCFESNIGASLGTGDDIVFPTVALGFPFSYAGSTYTDIEVSSNGFVWLGANSNFNSRCCAGVGTQFTVDPASIAILWTDIVADNTSGVHFNALPGRAVITWNNVREFGSNVYFTFQMQLTALGEVTFWYGPGTTITLHTMLAGITPGNNAANPGSVDLTANFPLNTNTDPTVFEEWPANAFDLAQRTWEIIPNGGNGWIALDRPGCQFVQGSSQTYGAGCPGLQGNPNAEFYEFFQPASSFDLSNTAIEMVPVGSNGYLVQPSTTTWWAGFSNATNLFDDQTVQVTLPFPFPSPAGVTSTVGLCSNGYVHLSGSTSANYIPNPSDFTTGPPRILGAMSDWYRPGAGQIYSDQVNATTWAFTWDGVAEFPNSTPAGTFQMLLEASGKITLIYQGVTFSAGRNMMTGFTRGNGVPDPGNTDISATMPFLAGTGILPLSLVQASGNPVIGTGYGLRIGNQPQAALAAFMLLGYGQASIPLDGIGMTGCTQLQTLDASFFVPMATPFTTVTLNIPNLPAFIGYSLYAQAAELAPGVNPAGIAASNGLAFTIGTY